MPDVNAPDKVLSAKDIPNPSETIDRVVGQEEAQKMLAEKIGEMRKEQLRKAQMSEDKGKYEFDRAEPEKLRPSVDLDAVEVEAVNILLGFLRSGNKDLSERAAMTLLRHVRESSK